MLIYKIATGQAWQEALAAGRYIGSADDLRDGFIHMSAAAQTRATLAKHFTAAAGLVIVAVETESLGCDLKWEVSRGSEKFPHLYTPLPIEAVVWWHPLAIAADGTHTLPPAFI